MTSAVALAADDAGTVSFVIGNATKIDSAGKSTKVVRGEKISAGETLVTGDSGHIHLTMVDKAFLSVRPKSRLKIQDYRYDAAVPANNRIKFVLEHGVARSITGRGGEASRENYRLNTPLAAIGIRGTDFVVLASEDVTRVHVQNGAVVVAPFGDGCLASAFGPCKSAATRVLTGAMNNAYLELRSRSEVPLLVPGEKGLEAPNMVAPPRAEEPPAAAAEKQIKSGISPESRDAIREAAVGTIKAQVDVVAAPPSAPETPAPPEVVTPPLVVVEPPPVVVVVPPVVTPPVVTPPIVTPPVVVPPPPAPQFWWGRWSSFIAQNETGKDLSAAYAGNQASREVGGGNDVFVLLREVGPVALPGSGVAKFTLANSEAFYLTGNKIAATAQINSPSLTIDFGARRYETSLSLSSAQFAPVTVQSSGSVSWQGQLLSDGNAATSLNGYLSRDTSQAGYVFDRGVSGNLSVAGATRWTR